MFRFIGTLWGSVCGLRFFSREQQKEKKKTFTSVLKDSHSKHALESNKTSETIQEKTEFLCSAPKEH